jgi:4-amino-4-deoxy-L-arabinose transferase-like glycosyltransferase
MALQTAAAVDASNQFRMVNRHGSRSLLWIVLVALALRLLVVCFLYPERTDPYRDHWRFGGEAGRIARSIAQGEGYSNPLFANTGSTSWIAPAFPYILAGIFKIFGVYSKASAIAILALDCLLSALTCIPIYFIAKKQFGDRIAVWAGWGWAFFPYAIFFSAYFIWATTLTTLLMTLVFLSVLQMEISCSPWRWAAFGVLSGLGGLSDPVVMSVAPFLGAWAWYRLHKSGRRSLGPAAVAVVAALMTTSPWFIRNYETFHKFIPFRSCLGLEVYCGNNPDFWHWGPPGYHPSDNENEWREYQQLGEIAYTQKKFHQGLQFIETHPAMYARQTLRRVVYLWTGFWSFSQRYLKEEPADPLNIVFCTALTILTLTGLRRAWQMNPNLAMPYVIVFLFFPIIYYLTHPEDYYRRPIDPEFVILAALVIAGSHKLSQPSEKRQQDEEPVLVEVER